MAWGEYPVDYDPAKHGPYDPSRYYGKPDTPFGEVKLGEIGSWMGRRNKGISPFMGLFSRAFWRWQMKYVQPKKTGVAPVFQVAVGASIFFYILNYFRIRGHRHYKYH
ncbi:ATP synthase, subunit F [Calliopsis andreniformis]|uniref:ATP synthase, subunit F n=1 Tax=Calliopsis andreniformis TaxID=337506 RepID=UPI003FCD4E7E